ncbi:MAG: YciI family protein [Saprospiraceae bacterium]|nr:YciI family protein [Saprospiraceae bacterium]
MKDYMFIIRGGHDPALERSPEEMQAHMQEWQKWMGGIASEGKLIGGQPLQSEARSLVDRGTRVIDRPLAEGKELVGGYIIVKANSLEEASQIATGCPGFAHDCTIEVREIMPM